MERAEATGADCDLVPTAVIDALDGFLMILELLAEVELLLGEDVSSEAGLEIVIVDPTILVTVHRVP